MKKYISLLLCIVVIFSAFVACSKDDADKGETKSKTTTGITTDGAVIKDGDAIRLIESYTAEELGLTEKDKNACSFMVSSYGEKLAEKKGSYYIKVVAVIKTPHEDPETKEKTYTFDYKGEYYIRYDGKEILAKDVKSGKLSEMKIKPVPTTTTEAE